MPVRAHIIRGIFLPEFLELAGADCLRSAVAPLSFVCCVLYTAVFSGDTPLLAAAFRFLRAVRIWHGRAVSCTAHRK